MCFGAFLLTLSYLGEFFFPRRETPQAIKLKLSYFKETSLRHVVQVIPVRYKLSYHGNKTTNGTTQNFIQ